MLKLHISLAPTLRHPRGRRTELNSDLLGTIFIRSQRPAADVHIGRVVFGLRSAVNFLTSLYKSLSPTANRCFRGKVAGAK